MEFIKRLTHLRQTHPSIFQESGTQLVDPCPNPPPPALHYIYAPMPPTLKQELVDSYVLTFPEELLALYDVANGCTLFSEFRAFGKFSISIGRLSVNGFPAGRHSADRLEPYNISIEDLSKPTGSPKTWLKFGSFWTDTMYHLYVDTDSKHVYSVDAEAKRCEIDRQWESIDQCLCELFDCFNDTNF